MVLLVVDLAAGVPLGEDVSRVGLRGAWASRGAGLAYRENDLSPTTNSVLKTMNNMPQPFMPLPQFIIVLSFGRA